MNKWLLFAAFFLSSRNASACSMCKITRGGKTIVGNNEDAWRTGSRIWFEQGRNGNYGAAYVGHDDGFPQGGLNDAGLAYDGFAVYPRALTPITNKPLVVDAPGFLKDILRHCATIDQVRHLVTRYDRRIFNQSMLLFVEKTGRYLVVEVDTVLEGNDASYILSNFCPSKTRPQDVMIDRYRRGRSFLVGHTAEATLPYCTALMDTMHECRRKIGDGTLYTSIYDLHEGSIYLYFYHDFSSVAKFNLSEELQEPDHIISLQTLFPDNREYASFNRYRTPFNTPLLRITLHAIFTFYVLSSLFLLGTIIRNLFVARAAAWRSGTVYGYAMFMVFGICLVFYIHDLLSTKAVYYFDAPYDFDEGNTGSLISFLPILLLIAIVPMMIIAGLLIRNSGSKRFTGTILILNLLTFLFLLGCFGYWKLFDIF